MLPLTLLYASGVLIGLVAVDGPPTVRVLVAALWPLGVAAFAVTIAMLVLAGLVLFPVVGALAAVAAALGWWLLA